MLQSRKRYRFSTREAAETAELDAQRRLHVVSQFFLAPRSEIKWFRRGPRKLGVLDPTNAVDGYAVTIWQPAGQRPMLDAAGTLADVCNQLQRTGGAEWRLLASDAAYWAYQAQRAATVACQHD